MKKVIIILMSLLAMMVASLSAKAQEITITLYPGWNWISYPNAEMMDIVSALGDFSPMQGDIINSQYGTSSYTNGHWRGSVTHFMPGWGYMYYSVRSEYVEFTFAQPSSNVVATATPTDVTATSALVGGMVILPEGSQVFLRGVCWGTVLNPDIYGSHTSDGTGIGSFTTTLDGLAPNTTYYVRAYMVNEYGLAYGNAVSFTTQSGIPMVTTAAVTDILGDGATCGGTVTDGGGLDITARGVCWSTSQNPTLSDSHTTDGTGTGSFVSTLTGLTPNATYYVRAYATTSQATSYGEEMTFTTMNGIPAVSTAEVTGITATTATCGGTVTDDGGLAITARGVCWSTSHNPTLSDSHTTDGTGTGSFTSSLTGLSTSTTYYVRAYASNSLVTIYGGEQSFTTEAGGGGGGDHAYVDLGLPSGTLWATCNVGANAPEEYGDYFAWGETQPKDTYNWSTYQYCNGSSNTLTKYCYYYYYGYNGFTDDLTTLEPSDDAATANWGEGWRMPTTADFEELYNNTTVTWTQQSGVNGRLFTAANGNSLFLPAAGYRWEDVLYDVDEYGNYYGFYWSSSLDTDYPDYAWRLEFGTAYCIMWESDRTFGLSVRAVRSSGQNISFVINATPNPTEGGAVSGGGTYAEGTTCTLTATASAGYTFTNWTENGEVVSVDATYSFTVNGDRNLVANFNVSGGDNHGYVDLGLPSGLLWATCNVGANSPEEYGDYFAWGETTPKDDYSWSTYLYCNGSSSSLTKYCNNFSYGYNGFTDNLTTLLPENDAATANWGNGWRMPTKEEWLELYNNTTVENGADGCLFTAANGNSLFLPAPGYHGYYWSSSLTAGNPSLAWNFGYGWDNFYMSNYDRHYGQSVRPVRFSGQNLSFVINPTPNPTEGGAVSGGGAYAEGAICTLTATASAGYAFTNWTENGEVVSVDATYSFTVNGDRNLVANFNVSGGDNHGYVDLGLPSGLLWATCNVGANAPEEYGEYFAWGENTPKDDYSWSTYQHADGDDGWEMVTKYCNDTDYGYNGFTDNLTTLLPEDDAATANWGSDWRMPTQAEFQELLDNTTVTWTTQNGVNGCLFTASNGNSLFLPAAGHRDDSGLTDAGYEVDYWSSSLDTDHPYNAWVFYFWWEDEYYVGSDNRNKGISVRPVRSLGQNNAPTGAINGQFSVSETQQVYFSQGNLQYQASTNTWKFAENQYDYAGCDTNEDPISSTYSGWIDLFGWGTSGYNHGANCYQPWSTSTSNSDYYAYGNDQYNLYDQTGQADWGYNPISNGGNTANQWRTLTRPEWNYVFNTRSTASGIRYARAQVNNVNGVILLPDDWSTSTYSLSNTNSSGASFSSNTLTVSEWSTLEQAGAVFLPAAGYRNGTSVNGVGSNGSYWSASYSGSNSAYYVGFDASYLSTSYSYRYGGHGVRLVCPAE